MLDLQSHKDEFDDYYRDHGIVGNRMAFPLQDIEEFDWGRGTNAQVYYCYMYRRFSVHILGRLAMQDHMSVLVVGCGVGSDEKNLRQLYPSAEIYGIDISIVMVKAAVKSKSPGLHVQGVAEALPFPDCCFDRIISREVIEHVADPLAMMREVERVLKPGGVAVIATENEESWSPQNLPFRDMEKRLRARVKSKEISRTQKYVQDEAPTLKEAKDIFHEAGLELVDYFYDGALYHHLRRIQDDYPGDRLARLAHDLSNLENWRPVARRFCDQVKYIVRKPEGAAKVQAIELWTPGGGAPVREQGAEFVAEATGERFPILDGVAHFGPISRPAAEGSHQSSDSSQRRRYSGVGSKLIDWISWKILAVFVKVYAKFYMTLSVTIAYLLPSNNRRISRMVPRNCPHLKYVKVPK